MEARGYVSLGDMLEREFNLRRSSHDFWIVLPIGLRVISHLGQGDMTAGRGRQSPVLPGGHARHRVGGGHESSA